ncbi:Hypothetical protein PHPALM_20476 [Phytophthora palmivora]|uniref:MULE transposase domain-containing protein n=1 Tax=Phytophthora palmivora TaxID=4796 RepID=A0A2P4XES1_9STRA|nr:Hypothetical protein PHPALM_20476 [Phytophthora palmivora]
MDHTCERGDEVESGTSDPILTSSSVTLSNPYMLQPEGGFQPPPVNRVARIGPNQIDPIQLGRIESPPLSLVHDSTLQFLQFNCMTGFGPNGTPNRVIGWAHPDLIKLLQHAGSTIYVDISFRRLPPGFEQCITLVVHDKPSEFSVPVFYILCTTRTLDSYRNALYFVAQATQLKLNPDEVLCDFDSDLLNALQMQFPNAVVKGSVYHFKKACRTRMDQLEISEEAINIAMEKGVLDMLVSISPDRVASAGIAWVKKQIKTKCAGGGVPYTQDQWRSFWVYFRRIWILRFPPNVWNMHGLNSSIIARTSNPLQQFLRELDGAFRLPDPSLQLFVATIERIARHHVADIGAETTTLPSAVEVHSDEETSSHEGSFGSNGDDDDDDDIRFIKTEASRGHGNVVDTIDGDEHKEEVD